MTAARWKSIAYVTAIFIVGAVTGASVAMSFNHRRFGGPMRPHDMIQQIRGRLRERLDLTPAQLQKIEPIVEKLGTEMRAIHLDAMQRAGKLMDNAHDQIAAELTGDQKRKLAQIERERHNSMRDRPPFPFRHDGSTRQGERRSPPADGSPHRNGPPHWDRPPEWRNSPGGPPEPGAMPPGPNPPPPTPAPTASGV